MPSTAETEQDAQGARMYFGDLYWGMVKALGYHCLRILFNLLRTLVWILTGTIVDHRSTQDPENYDHCAQVYDIFYRYKFDLILGQASFEDFVLTHDRFVSPSYLLQDECVLYQVTRTHAIFVEVDEGVEVWRGKYGSFLRQAQFLQARKVITLPLYALERLGDELGDPKAKLVFIQNTSRCGSTLLVRIFENTGRCVSFCEPDAVNGMCKLAQTKRLWDEETGKRMVRSLVRVQCKPVRSLAETPLAYILKMTAPSMEAAPFLVESFPEARHFFMYRDWMKVCESLSVAAEVMPTVKAVYLMGSISEKGMQLVVSQMGCSSNEFNMKISGHPLEPGIVIYSITVRKYHQMLDQGMEIFGIRYEDLAADAEYSISQILQRCDLPLTLLEPGMKAMKADAQEHSKLNTSNLQRIKKNYTMNDEVMTFMENVFTDFGIPLGRRAVLRNTVSHREMGSETVPVKLVANHVTSSPIDVEEESGKCSAEKSDRSSSCSSFDIVDKNSEIDRMGNGGPGYVHPMAPKFIRF